MKISMLLNLITAQNRATKARIIDEVIIKKLKLHYHSLWLLALFISAQSFAQTTSLTMSYEQWQPFYYSSNGKIVGLDIDIAREILDQQNISLAFKQLPFWRSLPSLYSGEIDLVGSMGLTDKRKRYLFYSQPYFRERYILYINNKFYDQFSGQTITELLSRGFRVGVTRGTFHGALFEPLKKAQAFHDQIIEVSSDMQNHKKLVSGRIDGFIQESSLFEVNNSVMKQQINITPLLLIGETDLHFVFSRVTTTETIVQQFNAGLQQLKQSGRYQEILARYRLSEHAVD